MKFFLFFLVFFSFLNAVSVFAVSVSGVCNNLTPNTDYRISGFLSSNSSSGVLSYLSTSSYSDARIVSNFSQFFSVPVRSDASGSAAVFLSAQSSFFTPTFYLSSLSCSLDDSFYLPVFMLAGVICGGLFIYAIISAL